MNTDTVTRADTTPTQGFSDLHSTDPGENTWAIAAPSQAGSPEDHRLAAVARPGEAMADMSLDNLEAYFTDDGDAVAQRVAATTRDILRSLRAPHGLPAASSPQVSTLARQPAFVVELRSAHQSGRDMDYMADLVDQAIARGELVPDPAFLTAQGAVDLPSLVAHHVPGVARPPTTRANQDFLYRVQPSDSLARLSLLFYGDSASHHAILAANQGQIRAANDITPGLLVTIPALNN